MREGDDANGASP